MIMRCGPVLWVEVGADFSGLDGAGLWGETLQDEFDS